MGAFAVKRFQSGSKAVPNSLLTLLFQELSPRCVVRIREALKAGVLQLQTLVEEHHQIVIKKG